MKALSGLTRGLFGGGDVSGLDEGDRARMLQLEQDRAVARINAIFGRGDTPVPTAVGARTVISPHDTAYQRELMYRGARDNFTALNNEDLARQTEKANREASFGLARRGLSGSSQENDLSGELADHRNRASIDIANSADSLVGGLRRQDEQSRLNLIDRIRSGLDSSNALSSANSQLGQNADHAQQQAKGVVLGNVFGDIAGIYGANQQGLGYADAAAAYQAARAKKLLPGQNSDNQGQILRQG